jgi:NO-binding membrane sensor protein with MHYT domain
MCQARVSLRFYTVFVWTMLGSVAFGFCSIWALHFVAMLAYELDLKIGINVFWTLLSSVLAVLFTFAALGSDLLWETYSREKRGNHWPLRREQSTEEARNQDRGITQDDSRPLFSHEGDVGHISPVESFELMQFDRVQEARLKATESQLLNVESYAENHPAENLLDFPAGVETSILLGKSKPNPESILPDDAGSSTDFAECSAHSASRRPPARRHSISTPLRGLNSIMNIAFRSTSPAKNAFVATGEALFAGFTGKNIMKGFLWSVAITGMHYTGIFALEIPNGYCTLNYFLVFLSGMISWCVCVVGCILMPQMETHLTRQFLFSTVATLGVAAMHFTGMSAATFWSTSPPSEARGYPPALAIAIVSIAIITCIAANGLLAHAATVSRNKLAEIVWTRRKLWRVIAQKENAEAAAAARSDFIASASHEIRTPLHHLQGYSDLLSQTELTEEGRLLLLSIQRATKTLSLSTLGRIRYSWI